MTKIIKASGELQTFKPNKLTRSLRRAGADRFLARKIADAITKKIKNGQTTGQIYDLAFKMLKKERDHIPAARYTLKRSIQELGPTGFPFEHFISRLYEAHGYNCEVGIVLRGKCVTHEIDVTAHKGNDHILIEAKFRNRPGDTIGVQVPLYMKSRFDDILAGENNIKKRNHRCLIFTNTHFSKDAIAYTNCIGGMELVGWNYPERNGLERMIESKGLHPITVLTMLNKAEKEKLMNNGLVVCQDVHDSQEQLHSLGLSSAKAQKVAQQARQLCELRSL